MDETTGQLLHELKRLRRGNPFVPFVITTKQGKRYDIVRPLQVGTNDVIVLVVPPVRGASQTFRVEDLASVVPAAASHEGQAS